MSITARIDSAIMAAFPGWGAARLKKRRQLELTEKWSHLAEARMERAYEAADSDRLRGEKWLTSKLSTNSQLEQDLETLRERAEDLYRNDCYAASAINGRVDNVVGCGIRYQSRVQPIEGVLTEEQATEFNVKREAAFRQWSRHVNLPAKQRQLERCAAIYGEAFMVWSDVGSADKPVPLTLQVINPKRVETPPGKEGRPNIRLGIEFDERTREPIAYYVRKSNPGDTHEHSLEYDRIPAARVFHYFEEVFPGQLRGVPWLAPAMGHLKDLKDFAEANLISEQIAACFSVFITTEHDPFNESQNAATGAGANNQRLEEIAPGIVQRLGIGEKVTFSDPNRPGSTLEPYMQWRLRSVAAALRYPYELLNKHYENSYSGGRLSLIDGRITFRCWQSQSIESVWSRVANRFADEHAIIGDSDIEPDVYLKHQDAFRRHAWIPQGWPWVDPVKEVDADIKAIAADLKTEADSLAERGYDWEEIQEIRQREKISRLKQQKALQEEAERLGIALPTDEPQERENADTNQPETAGVAS